MARLRQQVMGEAHYSRYSIYPGETKMYHDIRGIYRWDKMKKDIAEFVAQYRNCQQIKELSLRLISRGPSKKDWGLRCIGHPSKVILVDDVQVTENLSYEKYPIATLDRKFWRLRTKDVASVKVL
ncbi:uncharacterized protein [Nicotiana tomentosiformis]|uniref:uncharacterized protein n=1 Tax=Nicotiana tomentosiformis TaxID=4098 RepID=UPI00388CAF44